MIPVLDLRKCSPTPLRTYLRSFRTQVMCYFGNGTQIKSETIPFPRRLSQKCRRCFGERSKVYSKATGGKYSSFFPTVTCGLRHIGVYGRGIALSWRTQRRHFSVLSHGCGNSSRVLVVKHNSPSERILTSHAFPPPLLPTSANPNSDDRNKTAPWRPPGSPGSANVVASSATVLAAATAAAMTRSKRSTPNPRRNNSSSGTTRQSFGDKRRERAYFFPNERYYHEGGDQRAGGTWHGEGESPPSAGGLNESRFAEGRYAKSMVCWYYC